jgi:hypothetical protein
MHYPRRVNVRQATDRKTIAESLSQHDEKHVVPTPLSGIRVRRRRRRLIIIISKTEIGKPKKIFYVKKFSGQKIFHICQILF